MTNTNKKMIDLPFFELCNQSPTATAAGVSAMTTAEESNDSRYIYVLTAASTFYRYDTQGDTWQLLANPPTAQATVTTMRYTETRGFHGRVVAATSSSVTIPGLRGPTLDGATMRILYGTGAGQERVLDYTGETIYDSGVITATTTATLTDGLKKWRYNQWAGYMVGITFGTDATQYKKILYNDTTTLYIQDANLQPHDPWNNQAFSATTPYALPVVTAGLQANYQIMASTFNLNTNWTTTPDTTSFFTTLTGGVWLLSSAAATPFITLQYYDVIHDSWQTKTVPQSLVSAAYGTDASLERLGKTGNVYTTNVATISSTARTLTDSGQNMTPDRYDNYKIYITGGTGMGQNRRIVGHTATTFTIPKNWTVNPSTDSKYEVWPDTKLFLGGGAAAALFAYSTEFDYWVQGQNFDEGITVNMSVTQGDFQPWGITSGTRIASGITAINPTPTVAGSAYSFGDILTCAVGGLGAQVRVTGITPSGGVTTIELINSGTTTGYTTGTGKATTGGTGTGCTIEITSVGVVTQVTTATNHWLRTGETITIAGCTEAAYNTTTTVLCTSGINTFFIATTATANMAASLSQSTTTIVDSTASWIVNEHVGRIVHLCVAGTAPTSQIRWITANTATTLTVATITAGVNGTSKYSIYDAKVFGVDDQRREADMVGYGRATGGTTTTLVDSSKNWIPGQWNNYLFKIEAGTGYGSGRISIISNTSNTLTYSTQTFSPDTTTKYEIADSWGLVTTGGAASTLNITEATTKNWQTNYWAGKRVRYTAGTNVGVEGAVASNTATAITTSAAYTTDTTTAYAIVAIPARGAGTQLIWNWGLSLESSRGKNFYFPRGGGSNTMDIYDITTGKWLFGYFISPQAELFTTGSSYAYDGVDTMYLSRSATGLPIRIFGYNMLTNRVDGGMTSTWLQGTATIGNMMEIVSPPSDPTLKYIYILQNTGTLLSRALIF